MAKMGKRERIAAIREAQAHAQAAYEALRAAICGTNLELLTERSGHCGLSQALGFGHPCTGKGLPDDLSFDDLIVELGGMVLR